MKKARKKFLLLVFVSMLAHFQNASAQMSSGNYKINADSVNFGGNVSSSAAYKLGDTLGELATGEGSSANYKTKAGFQYMANSYLALSVDSNTKDLGTLMAGTPVTSQSTVTVSTDAWNGYVLAVSKNHQMLHTDTVTTINDHNGSIAVPVLWQSPNNLGFGFTIAGGTGVDPKWGSSPNYKYAAFPGTSSAAHSKTGFKNNPDETVVGYKADVTASQKAGAYSCAITYTAVGSI